jgi:mannose-6-phosphate isomerase-like protein (cupin superfamily)
MEEIFYVMAGTGSVEVGKESAPITKGDAIPIMLNETHAMVNNGTTDLELMVIGISMQKGRMDTALEK